MRYWNHPLSTALITGISIGWPMTIASHIQPSSAINITQKSHEEVAAIAKAVTVQICPTQGSGVIISKQGNLYKVLTNRHVVQGSTDRKNSNPCTKSARHTIVTADGKRHLANPKSIKNLPDGLDMAVIEFRSSQNYPIAQLSTSSKIAINDRIHTAGYPASTGRFTDSAGDVLASSNRVNPLTKKDGYSMVYNAYTMPGMSGSGVWNSQGQIVAIHGFGWRYETGTNTYNDRSLGQKVGWNMGIPIDRFRQQAKTMGVTLPAGTDDQVLPSQKSSPDDYFIAATDKYIRPGGETTQSKKAALNYLNLAIQGKPDYVYAYFLRGIVRDQLQDYTGALADYNRVIALNPNYSEAYNNLGTLQENHFQNYPQALKEYSRAIEVNPNDAIAYNNRGALKTERFQDYQGALSDYNRAIAINPNYHEPYYNRGVLKKNHFRDDVGALADYDQAITLNTNDPDAYNNRGVLRRDYQKDYPKALADFDRAIEINPNYANAYANRGAMKYNNLRDTPGAIQDLQIAAKLLKQQGRQSEYQTIREALRLIGGTEL
jgi:Flp pilus assembly protein TadD/S1-C subfamily serine protease